MYGAVTVGGNSGIGGGIGWGREVVIGRPTPDEGTDDILIYLKRNTQQKSTFISLHNYNMVAIN